MKKYIVGVLWLGLFTSVALAVYWTKQYFEVEQARKLLDKKGVIVDASTIGKDASHKTSVSAVGSSTAGSKRYSSSYVLRLRFDANSEKGTLSFNKEMRGEPQDFDLSNDYREIEVSVSERKYWRAFIGSKFPIKYLPEDPDVYETLNEAGEYYPNRIWYACIFLYFYAGVSCVTLYIYYKTGKLI